MGQMLKYSFGVILFLSGLIGAFGLGESPSQINGTLPQTGSQKTITQPVADTPNKIQIESQKTANPSSYKPISDDGGDVGTYKPVSTDESDSYINVDGERVQSPTYYPSAPAGASAQCNDGTYSFSRNRRGTCSGHGGVAQWL
jgi:hypothetical protein